MPEVWCRFPRRASFLRLMWLPSREAVPYVWLNEPCRAALLCTLQCRRRYAAAWPDNAEVEFMTAVGQFFGEAINTARLV